MSRILVVDVDATFTKVLTRLLTMEGYQVDIAHNVKTAISLLNNQHYDLYLLDYRLPDGTGFDIITESTLLVKKTPVVMMTSFNDVRTTVQAMRLGVYDYIVKPVHPDELLLIISEVLLKNEVIVNEFKIPDYVLGINVESEKLQSQINMVAGTNISVIIQGESGTGKENIAKQIHNLSSRANKPFIAVDCGTLSPDLVGSELFGHQKGAFTGAIQTKKGKLEEAEGGTLFLDEIFNLSYDVQIKLLRVLQERVMQPIGSNKDVKINIRIIAATNEDLKVGVENGNFRKDLYYRLNEFKINVPSFRKRISDLPLFVDFFIKESNKDLGRNVKQLTADVLEIFIQYEWPGNIRELRNIIRRLVLLSSGETVDVGSLPEEMITDVAQPHRAIECDLKIMQENIEKELIEKTLNKVRFNKSKAAKLLNIDRSTLYAKLTKYNITA